MAQEAAESKGKADAKKRTARVLGGFQIISKIGRGGMGTVYKALQLSMDRMVALKILTPRLADNKRFIRRFNEEARAVARLNHVNIVQGIDAGQAGGYFYFAMEYVDGETVHKMIAREGAIDEKRALRITRDIARALVHAHRYHLVHRDIKPGNIMVTKYGVTKLCDLGLARQVSEGLTAARRVATTVGTPYYISPEQARGFEDADIRSDIYSLGATFHRMVVGEPPFDGATPEEIVEKHVKEPLPWPKDRNPALSDSTCHLITKMMAKSPDERYQTPEELERDVERVLLGEEPSALRFEFGDKNVRHLATRAKETGLERGRRKKRALRQFLDVRDAIREVAAEQKIAEQEVINVLRGNLPEDRPDTFLKYGLMLLADRRFARARKEFQRAKVLGADTSTYEEKLNALGSPRGMVYVAAGKFLMDNGRKGKQVSVPAFYIDILPVTNSQYKRFVDQTNHRRPSHWKGGEIPEGLEDHPVVDVSYEDAQKYAQWAEKRLPTGREWEKAARGTGGLSWPWGDEFDSELCNTSEAGIGNTTPVGAHPQGASPYGCLDMAGNVLEWTCNEASQPDDKMKFYAVRGGSWADTKEQTTCFSRSRMRADRRSSRCGFRCVRDL